MMAGEEPATDLLDEVADRVRERFGPRQAERYGVLVRDYYRHVAPADLEGRSPSELYGAAISHLQLARRRSAGQPIVRIYDPSVEDDGWSSAHTVVDVVVDDCPFLVASVTMAVEAAGFEVHLLVHPVLRVRREGDQLVGPAEEGGGAELHEAFVHLEIDRIVDRSRSEALRERVMEVLSLLRVTVQDWQEMTSRADRLAAELEATSEHPSDQRADAAELLRWMAQDEFLFLGVREYRLDPAEGVIRSVPESGLGILRHRPPSNRPLSELTLEGAALATSGELLLVTKTNSLSPLHRPAPMDYVGIRRRDPTSGILTEHRFIGLFTSRTYTETITRLPVVRRKVAEVIARAGFAPRSHDANRLLRVLEEHPRDELFQASVEELLETTLGIIRLYERRQVGLFLRRDAFGRFYSCLVYVPRDRFRTEVRQEIQYVLGEVLGGRASRFELAFSSSTLARLHVIVEIAPGPLPEIDPRTLEARIERLTRTWADQLEHELIEHFGEGPGLELAVRWRSAFPAGYREDVSPESAVLDIERLELLAQRQDHDALLVSTHHPVEAEEASLRVKLYRHGKPVTLSTVLPMLQDHGVAVIEERPYQVSPAGGHFAWIHDFGLQLPHTAAENAREHGEAIRRRFEDSLLAVWGGHADSDGFCELVLDAGLTWREVSLVRALARYLRQAGSTFTPAYIQEVVTHHAGITKLLVERFHTRLDPDRIDPAHQAELSQWILDALDTVASLDEDRILRGLNALVAATVRTNLYQRDASGEHHDHVVLKLEPTELPDLPQPRPRHEIFVSSSRVEGVHLRAGRVARGGIRWSERREDYRTEILGLLKAQVVKNAVIVPAGAKGGFICRQLPADGDPEAIRREVERCYLTFIGGLLDITDNLVAGDIRAPERVVRLDGDDPYLVVAADKGTATFSDLANSVAKGRDFWLGDAFASGGSTGYDHKAMGITARGAWVSVRRHLAELDIDPDQDDITVVGIGDMSGDVFGNGMLCSRHIRLVAAFDHRHVFIDPDPDPHASWEERKRLFELPGSSWADYERTVLSPGGLVVPRSAKAVTIGPGVASVLGCEEGQHTPSELIQAILRAPVDLLWNGGIGTYVKASVESSEDAADRANDSVRVNGSELRCLVVAEGGNLGLTQRGRIEAAQKGVLLNTDAIDNSAGVDCSDHEVNLKILLDSLVLDGELTQRQRDQLLVELTEDVAAHVLSNNAAQTLALASARRQASGMTDVHARHLRWLERSASLVRELEALPTDEEMAERRIEGLGMTQPELAVVMAYTKNLITGELLSSALPDEPAVATVLSDCLPRTISQRFPDALARHPLRRELISTRLTNLLVNRAGVSMTLRLIDETAAPIDEILRAHLAAWRLFDLDPLWSEIEGLEGQVPISVMIEMLLETKRLGERITRWILRNRHSPIDIEAILAELSSDVREVLELSSEILPVGEREELEQSAATLVGAGVPPQLALRVVAESHAPAALDIVEAARAEGALVELAARAYYLIGERLSLGWLRARVDALPREDRWSTLARSALRDDLADAQAGLLRRILSTGGGESAEARVARWAEHQQQAIDRFAEVLADIRSTGAPDLAQLSVGLREIRNLARRAGTVPVAPEAR